ncbi:MAG: cation:proton antiporter [Thermoplasmata archaeon]|nr:MAG: cation:proton antiporter [Thermoplasmata archaeon]
MIPECVIYLFLGIGLFFNFMGSIGLMRMPDIYTRLHAATKCTTFGSIFTSLAVIIYGILWWYDGHSSYAPLATHTIVALAAILVTNPTGAHAIARASHRAGVKPERAVVDRLEEVKLP